VGSVVDRSGTGTGFSLGTSVFAVGIISAMPPILIH
jgi:hypothetical protein